MNSTAKGRRFVGHLKLWWRDQPIQ